MAHNLTTGTPDVKQDQPSHTKGVRMGNAPGGFARQRGHLPGGTATAERSTGINPASHGAIDPRMPNLTPP